MAEVHCQATVVGHPEPLIDEQVAIDINFVVEADFLFFVFLKNKANKNKTARVSFMNSLSRFKRGAAVALPLCNFVVKCPLNSMRKCVLRHLQPINQNQSKCAQKLGSFNQFRFLLAHQFLCASQ